MSELFEIVLDAPEADPGARLTGTVHVLVPGDVRRILIEVVRTEASSGVGGVGESIVASHHLTGPRSFAGGERLPFAVDVPADAGPEIVTPHARVGWTVRGRADVMGPDLTAGAPLRVRLRRDLTPSAAALARLSAGPVEQERSNRIGTGILGWTFLGLGVVFTVLTAGWATHPPESWDGSLGPLWFTGGLAALMLLAGGLALRSNQRKDLPGVALATAEAVRTDHPSVGVRVNNATGAPVQLGRLCVEVVLTVRGSGQYRSTEHREHLLDEAWIEVPPGEHVVTLPLTPGLPPSLIGDHVSFDHRLVVVTERPKHPLAARVRHLRRLVVLP